MSSSSHSVQRCSPISSDGASQVAPELNFFSLFFFLFLLWTLSHACCQGCAAYEDFQNWGYKNSAGSRRIPLTIFIQGYDVVSTFYLCVREGFVFQTLYWGPNVVEWPVKFLTLCWIFSGNGYIPLISHLWHYQAEYCPHPNYLKLYCNQTCPTHSFTISSNITWITASQMENECE